MKRIMLLMIVFIFSICGCGKNDEVDSSKTPDIEEIPTTPIVDKETPTPATPVITPVLPTGGNTPVVTPVDYGTMMIEDLTLYTNFPNKPVVKFSNPEYAVSPEEVCYSYDSDYISYDGEYFEVNSANKTITVTATTKYHTTEFTINTRNYVNACKDQANANFYLNRVNQKELYWQNGGSLTEGTIFIGDSFFDTEFWSNFYTLYLGNNAYTNGVSSSTTTDWEIWAGRLLYPMNPKNIVMHCGTNNLYDDFESSEETIRNTQRLLEAIHYHLPNAKVYYFAIEPRTYGIGGTSFNSTTYNKIQSVNDAMKTYCEQNAFMVYLDVTSNCYTSGINVNSSFFRDGVHPTLENYLVYANALKDAGLDLTLNPSITDNKETTKELVFTTDMAINKGDQPSIVENGKALVKEFSVKGNLLVTQVTGNAHIQFAFDGTAANRFLLWDNDNNRTLQAGYACNNIYMSNVSSKGVTVNNQATFELVVTTKNAYLYINDELVMVFVQANPVAVYFGTEGCAVSFTDLVITSKINDEAGYNAILSRDEITEYENSNLSKQVIVN